MHARPQHYSFYVWATTENFAGHLPSSFLLAVVEEGSVH